MWYKDAVSFLQKRFTSVNRFVLLIIGCLIFVCLLLGAHYYYLRKSSVELLALKEDYRMYTMALKRTLDRKIYATSTEENGEKKKVKT